MVDTDHNSGRPQYVNTKTKEIMLKPPRTKSVTTGKHEDDVSSVKYYIYSLLFENKALLSLFLFCFTYLILIFRILKEIHSAYQKGGGYKDKSLFQRNF